MTPFFRLPPWAQDLVCFWALLVCLGGIADCILLLRQRRYRRGVPAALCFAGGYFLAHLCREGMEQRLYGTGAPFVLRLLQVPAFLPPALLLLLTLACLALLADARRWRETHVAPASIKESVDGLPAGVCYYLEDGRCILVNHRMNEICRMLCGHSLQNGRAFSGVLGDRDSLALADGTAVAFRRRTLTFRGAPLHELIADDITELYGKSGELRAENERARQLAAGMKAYGETIADTVRRRELLQAKAHIHDEMNRMILATRKSALGEAGEEERREILRMWRGQAQLLSSEAEAGRSRSVVSDLNALASVIGVRLRWEGTPAAEEVPVLSLFLAAAREAMVNAAKHAGAGELAIRVEETDSLLRAVFENGGEVPPEPPRETGGLLDLRRRLEQAGGRMTAEAGDRFRLTVTIPRKGEEHALQSAHRGGSGNAPAAL